MLWLGSLVGCLVSRWSFCPLVGRLDEVFQFEAPAAVFRGTIIGYLGNKRPRSTYGTKEDGFSQIGGINGVVVMYRQSESVYRAMLWRLHGYTIPSKGADQDFLTDFFKEYFTDIRPLVVRTSGRYTLQCWRVIFNQLAVGRRQFFYTCILRDLCLLMYFLRLYYKY